MFDFADDGNPDSDKGSEIQIKVAICLSVTVYSQPTLRARGRVATSKPKTEVVSKIFFFDPSQQSAPIFWIKLLAALGKKYEMNYSPILASIPPFSWRLTGSL
jgi:hypothetical protein